MNIPVQELPGLSELYRDYVTSFEKISSFYEGDYRDKNTLFRLAEAVKNVNRPFRKELVDIVTDQNKSFKCSSATLENINNLLHSDTLAVVTGQQVGLFSGPLYTIYKALTTVKYAQELSNVLHVPVVPVFYLVSEDHDFAEVQWAGYIDKKNCFNKLKYEPGHLADRIPVADIVLDSSIESVINEISEGLADTEFKSEIIQSLKECYQAGKNFNNSFACWFTKLLHKYGIIILDASDARLKPYMRPVFERELRENITTTAIQKTNEKLNTFGYHNQLSVFQDRPGLFIIKDGRHSLEKQNNGYRDMNSGHVFSIEELLDQPQNLSPKATLRTIVEDTLLPTIAYVGGPAEIAYWGQLKDVYKAFHLPMPVVIPRAGFTLIEPKLKRHFERYDVSAYSFILEAEETVKKIMTSLIPDDIRIKIAESSVNIEKEWRRLSSDVLKVDPTLESVIEKTKTNMEKQLYNLEQKIFKSIQQREKVVSEQLRTITEHLLARRKITGTSANYSYPF